MAVGPDRPSHLTGHDTYGAGEEWRAGAHDDLVIAVAMAAWYGGQQYRGLADMHEIAAAIGMLFHEGA